MVERSLNAALDALEEGIQVLSPEFRYLHVNEAAARHGRKSREELLGRSMIECYPGIDRTPMFASLSRCMRDRSSATLENEFAYENGDRTWYELRVRPCPAGLVVVSIDVSERKSMELRLASAYEQALRDLVTPVIRVHRSVLLVPLVGALSAGRAAQVTETVLTRVCDEAARVVIFDVAGMPELDTDVAHHLLQATSMIKLLGVTTILTGLSPAAAKAIVHLGVDLSAMSTRSQLADGLELALAKVGTRVVGGHGL
jgi:PAS domain S-box-containing protein